MSPGDIIKITRCKLGYEQGRLLATPPCPLWAIVTDVFKSQLGVDFLVGGTTLAQSEVFPDWTADWTIETTDTYEVVPKEKIPDKVWRAIGERALTMVRK